jgi:hypothetical protein
VEPTKEDDLDRPDTIAGPGALIMAMALIFQPENRPRNRDAISQVSAFLRSRPSPRRCDTLANDAASLARFKPYAAA